MGELPKSRGTPTGKRNFCRQHSKTPVPHRANQPGFPRIELNGRRLNPTISPSVALPAILQCSFSCSLVPRDGRVLSVFNSSVCPGRRAVDQPVAEEKWVAMGEGGKESIREPGGPTPVNSGSGAFEFDAAAGAVYWRQPRWSRSCFSPEIRTQRKPRLFSQSPAKGGKNPVAFQRFGVLGCCLGL